MSNYNTTKRYCPHLITTKINAVCSVTIDVRPKV